MLQLQQGCLDNACKLAEGVMDTAQLAVRCFDNSCNLQHGVFGYSMEVAVVKSSVIHKALLHMRELKISGSKTKGGLRECAKVVPIAVDQITVFKFFYIGRFKLRSDKAGKLLAEVFVKGLQGNMPLTRIGLSFGARTIFKCLKNSAESNHGLLCNMFDTNILDDLRAKEGIMLQLKATSAHITYRQRDTLNKTMGAKSYEEKVPTHLMKYADERDSA
ncbi:transmembrane and coiled-coil domain-containing protein 4-like protein [Tanacetum coccineum]